MVLRLLAHFFVFTFLLACKGQPKTCEDCQEKFPTGKELYYNQCAACHGVDGKLGNSGAKDLSKSKLTDSQILEILHEGKGAMPAQIQLIGKQSEIYSVVRFVKTLRK